MACVPTFQVKQVPCGDYAIFASWPKGHVEQLVGLFKSYADAQQWANEFGSDFVQQLGPPYKRNQAQPSP